MEAIKEKRKKHFNSGRFKPRIDLNSLISQKFGRLTITNAKRIDGKIRCLCVCECGSKNWHRLQDLKRGDTRSCGCLKSETSKRNFAISSSKHGLSDHPMYAIWACLNNRCYNVKNRCYEFYGARGITVCDEWKSEKFGGLPDYYGLKNFTNWCDLNPRPSPKHSLDRMNNEEGYKTSNCKWSTAKEQIANTRPKIKRSNYLNMIQEKDRIIVELKLANKKLTEFYNQYQLYLRD